MPRMGLEFVSTHFPAPPIRLRRRRPGMCWRRRRGAGDLPLEGTVRGGRGTRDRRRSRQRRRHCGERSAASRALAPAREHVRSAEIRRRLDQARHRRARSIAMPEFLEQGIALVSAIVPGVRPVPFGHLGDGNIHFNFSVPKGADNAAFLARWNEVSRAVHDLVARFCRLDQRRAWAGRDEARRNSPLQERGGNGCDAPPEGEPRSERRFSIRGEWFSPLPDLGPISPQSSVRSPGADSRGRPSWTFCSCWAWVACSVFCSDPSHLRSRTPPTIARASLNTRSSGSARICRRWRARKTYSPKPPQRLRQRRGTRLNRPNRRVTPVAPPEPIPARSTENALRAARSLLTEPPVTRKADGHRSFRPEIEKQFGGRAFVWLGGIALALAGFFLVKYSIETGLLNERVRVVLGLLLGLGLLGGSHVVHARPSIADGRRISQALAGAGIADLYGSLFAATSLYHILPAWLGFLLMAAVTLYALVLSLRQGAPIAALGLIGGYATPLMVAGEPNAPLLFAYLYLVFGGPRLDPRQHWQWLPIPQLDRLCLGGILARGGLRGQRRRLALSFPARCLGHGRDHRTRQAGGATRAHLAALPGARGLAHPDGERYLCHAFRCVRMVDVRPSLGRCNPARLVRRQDLRADSLARTRRKPPDAGGVDGSRCGHSWRRHFRIRRTVHRQQPVSPAASTIRCPGAVSALRPAWDISPRLRASEHKLERVLGRTQRRHRLVRHCRRRRRTFHLGRDPRRCAVMHGADARQAAGDICGNGNSASLAGFAILLHREYLPFAIAAEVAAMG